MKPIVKIIILCILIIGMSIYATKKTIDYTFQEVECSHSNEATALHFSLNTEHLPSFIILWIAAGVCLSNKARKLTDKEVRFLFTQEKMSPRYFETMKWTLKTRLLAN